MHITKIHLIFLATYVVGMVIMFVGGYSLHNIILGVAGAYVTVAAIGGYLVYSLWKIRKHKQQQPPNP